MGTRAMVAVACAWVIGPGPLTAQVDDVLEGNRRYQAGDYAGAVAAYDTVLSAGYESAILYYNLGNAYFKLGELGPAVLAYERAVDLDPGDADARHNLALAQSLTVDEVTPLPGFWLVRAGRALVSRRVVGWARATAMAAYLVASAAVIVAVASRRPVTRRWAWRGAVVSGAVAIAAAVPWAARAAGWGRTTRAVVMADAVTVYSAPSADPALELFSIHEGITVRVDQRAEDWVEIVLADGKVGWVPREAVEVI